MSALVPPGLLDGVGTKRDEQIERFIRENPKRFKRLAPVVRAREALCEPDQNDRAQLGDTLGAYRRKKQKGSDHQ